MASKKSKLAAELDTGPVEVVVKRIHRRDLNRTWEFLKLVFREVNRETVEYQRPRTKRRFLEIYEEDGVEQLLFTVGSDIVGYAESTYAVTGADNWMNPRYFDKKGMRPLFVEEIAVHPAYQGRGVGSYMLDQLHHLAHLRGCTHLLLEVAENNTSALSWYRKRSFYKLDAAIFLAQKIPAEPDLLEPRSLPPPRTPAASTAPTKKSTKKKAAATKKAATKKAATPAATKKAATTPAATKKAATTPASPVEATPSSTAPAPRARPSRLATPVMPTTQTASLPTKRTTR